MEQAYYHLNQLMLIEDGSFDHQEHNTYSYPNYVGLSGIVSAESGLNYKTRPRASVALYKTACPIQGGGNSKYWKSYSRCIMFQSHISCAKMRSWVHIYGPMTPRVPTVSTFR